MARLSPEAARHKVEYNTQYQKENIDRLVIKTKKTERLPEKIDKAIAQGEAVSRQKFIIDSVIRRLDELGITLDE